MALEPLAVLLVEDNPAEAELIMGMLREARWERVTAEHAGRLADGLGRLAAGGFDAMLLDFSLPDASGMATFRRVREAAPELPVIILTNLDDEETAVRAVREGAQDYLVKRQVDSELLVRSLRYAVERKRGEEALRRSEERYMLAVEGANDGVWDWDLTTGEAFFSPRWREMLGLEDPPADEAARIEGWFSRVVAEDREGLQLALQSHLEGGATHFEHEFRMEHGSGHTLWVLARGLAVRNRDGRPTRIAGSLADITARKRAEEQLLHDAFHDALTLLPNRALFLDRLGLAMEQHRRRSKQPFAVLFLDLDRFKNVNDSLGHNVGDVLLVEFSRRLSHILRPGDTVARMGGDEFAILLTDVHTASDATRVAERVLELVRAPFTIGSHEVFVTCSIGISISPNGYQHPDEMVRDADTAMYRAKAAGRACYQVFDQEMHRTAVNLLKLEMSLRRAVDQQQFAMHYQPIVSLQSGRIVGFEGLVRWVHPQRGLVLPARFIAVAEETGLIVPIGWWVLREACQQARVWQTQFPSVPPLFMSVNVSGKLVMQSDMVPRVWQILEETGLPAESLRLEITESLVFDHGEVALEKLSQLRALGVQFSIDDFGTGYSSLSYLQRFNYDTVKIDRSFIAGMDSRQDGEVIVQAIVALARMLGINVVAEGVETPAQLAQLRAMECPHGQGFWFSHPVDGIEAEALLVRRAAW